jgi:hypothetical protein
MHCLLLTTPGFEVGRFLSNRHDVRPVTEHRWLALMVWESAKVTASGCLSQPWRHVPHASVTSRRNAVSRFPFLAVGVPLGPSDRSVMPDGRTRCSPIESPGEGQNVRPPQKNSAGSGRGGFSPPAGDQPGGRDRRHAMRSGLSAVWFSVKPPPGGVSALRIPLVRKDSLPSAALEAALVCYNEQTILRVRCVNV